MLKDDAVRHAKKKINSDLRRARSCNYIRMNQARQLIG
jgi:hypothetical protein